MTLLDVDDWVITLISVCVPLVAFVFSTFYFLQLRRINIDPAGLTTGLKAVKGEDYAVIEDQNVETRDGKVQSGSTSMFQPEETNLKEIWKIYNLIYTGAHSFLYAEYRYIGVFVVFFAAVIVILLGITDNWTDAWLTAMSFIVGCVTSVVAGFLGMKIGVYTNARTSLMATNSLEGAFVTAFKGGIIMGFVLTGLGVLSLFILIQIVWTAFPESMESSEDITAVMFDCVAGFGLGGSCIGLFGRVGGGIYTKAADVGADLVGKIEQGMDEDDPRNPACIADNVGDNVGDIAGMGADLFGSFAESSCATLVIASQSTMWDSYTAVMLPLMISASGILVCMLTSLVATKVIVVKELSQIEPSLKRQLLVSTILMTPVLFLLCEIFLPEEIVSIGGTEHVASWQVFVSGACGLWTGLAIGYITEYYTSYSYKPVQQVSNSCETGAATNIIYGLALGYKSTIIPIICLALSVFISLELAGYYGVGIAALGILSTLSIGLTIDAFGPICDNAGGIAEMSGLPSDVRVRTDALDAAGNTTAAIGKGFAIASAALVSLALFSGYVTVIGLDSIDILDPIVFAGILIGAMLPYWFTALTMKSVGKAALVMVEEVRSQFRNNKGILEGTAEPNYEKCIRISTEASLREMFAPGALVMFTPLFFGYLCGTKCLAGVLIGALTSGVQMAISQSNSGGAWDNAKKYIEKGALGEGKGKGSDIHKAAVIGDTVGDPLKDTSGPSLNILIKLMAIISLVFAKSFPTDAGGLIGKLFGYTDD